MPAYEKLSKFPSIRRDIALIVDQSVSFSAISNTLKNAGIDELSSHRIFDVYEGVGVEAKQKSLALSLIFQDFSRTLEDQEVEAEVAKVLSALTSKLGAELRA